MIGKTLAHYQIAERLGKGPMGAVYKDRHTHLDRVVAIATMPSEETEAFAWDGGRPLQSSCIGGNP